MTTHLFRPLVCVCGRAGLRTKLARGQRGDRRCSRRMQTCRYLRDARVDAPLCNRVPSSRTSTARISRSVCARARGVGGRRCASHVSCVRRALEVARVCVACTVRYRARLCARRGREHTAEPEQSSNSSEDRTERTENGTRKRAGADRPTPRATRHTVYIKNSPLTVECRVQRIRNSVVYGVP
jgi:hypothetical protein